MPNDSMRDIEFRIKPNDHGWWVGELFKDGNSVVRGTGCSTALGAFDEMHHVALDTFGLAAIAHK